jgi:hypothetical protein
MIQALVFSLTSRCLVLRAQHWRCCWSITGSRPCPSSASTWPSSLLRRWRGRRQARRAHGLVTSACTGTARAVCTVPMKLSGSPVMGLIRSTRARTMRRTILTIPACSRLRQSVRDRLSAHALCAPVVDQVAVGPEGESQKGPAGPFLPMLAPAEGIAGNLVAARK